MGSSATRTHTQKEEAKTTVVSLVQDKSSKSIVAFTDGSCLGNPGPCGSGAAIYMYLPEDPEPVCLVRPVASRGSILLAELIAILAVLEFTVGKAKESFDSLAIFSDSQSAIGISTLGWESSSHKQVVRDIHRLKAILVKDGKPVTVEWAPGHADIKGNDLADELAKKAAVEAKAMSDEDITITKQDVKKLEANQQTTLAKWQLRWDLSD